MSVKLFNHPVLCNYYLTYRCNARCGFCDIWEKPSPYVTYEAVQSNLLDLKKLGVRVIDFTGGEPLLHRELPKFLELAKSLGFITTVTTNALLYPKYGAELKGLVDMLHFSLDAATAEKHNQSRGVECWDHVMKSIQIARDMGERPDIIFTLTDDSILDAFRVWREIAQPNGLILILNPIFAYNGVGSDLSPTNFPRIRLLAKQQGVYLNDAFLTLRENGGNQIDDPICVAGSSTIVISPENKLVMPCYHLNIKEIQIENNLYALWRGAEVQSEVRMEGRHAGCQGCAVNCYMQPSFAYQVNRYFFGALPSTLKYTFEKWVYDRV